VGVLSGLPWKTLTEIRNSLPRCKADTFLYPRYMRRVGKGRAIMTALNTSATGSGTELDARRKKLRFRSWHRGMREMDMILGRFADAHMATLTDEEIDQYEGLLEFPDDQFFLLITGERPVPQHLDCPLLQRILVFGRTYEA